MAVPIVAGLALAAASLAWLESGRDSVTVDEPSHLAAGWAALHLGDYRLSPDHPPLARVWAALPLLAEMPRFPESLGPGWHEGDFIRLGRGWLGEAGNGLRLLRPARTMIVALLAVLIAAVFAVAAQLFGPTAGLIAAGVAALEGGTYVISINELLGVYQPLVRDSTWSSEGIFRQVRSRAARVAAPGESDADGESARAYDPLRRARLINRLAHRAPDDRVGTSLLIFRLAGPEVSSLARPCGGCP